MTYFSGIGIGLSLVFGCLLFAFVAELYYLLWWKKRVTTTEIIEVDYNNNAKELFYLFCWTWKRPSSSSSSSLHRNTTNNQEHSHVRVGDTTRSANGSHEPSSDIELGSNNKDVLLKSFGEESVESELMRLHNLSGPPRFLFTISEETKEDLESEDGKSRGDDRSRKGSRTRSLSDVLVNIETPFLTPVASPIVKPSSPFNNLLDSYSHHGFNPLFESSAEAELNRLRSSPPPKFKFMRDAEEKLVRRLLEEAEKRAIKSYGSYVQDKIPDNNASSIVKKEEKDGSFVALVVGKNKERETHHYSTSSQVLPLSSSPTSTFRPPCP